MLLKKKLLVGLLGLVVIINPLPGNEIDVSDISALHNYSFLYRSKNYTELKSNITSQKEPSYLESYLMGYVLQKEHKYKESLTWFARAAFKYKSLPPSHGFEVIKSYMDSGIRRSGLYAECVYEVSRIYLSLGNAENASQILELLPNNIDPVLEKKVLEYRVEIISKLNPSMAIEVYKSILKDYQSPLLYLRLGSLNLMKGETIPAFDNFFKTLEFESNQWTYKKAAEQINLVLEKAPDMHNQINDIRKVKLGEAMRIERKYHQSLIIWKSIQPENLNPEELSLYVQNYCRLNISMRQYHRCLQIVKKHLDRLDSEQKEMVLTDAGERLFRADQFDIIVAMVPPGEYRGTSLLRIRSMEKIRHKDRKKEAGEYLQKYDNDSTFAEGVFFSTCFEAVERKKYTEALECLTELKNLTVNVSAGGRARYFIGRIYEDLGDFQKADESFKDVYLNSPDHFYAFGALTKTRNFDNTNEISLPDLSLIKDSPERLAAVRKWIADNYNNEKALRLFFSEKKKHPEFGVDSFWLEFEKKLGKVESSLSASEKKASAFLTMGLDSAAEEYFSSSRENLERKFWVFLYSGLVTHDAYLKATYIQGLLNLYHKQADILTASQLAVECLYPTPYRSIVSSASERHSIEEAQVYALMKQESGFHPGATSRSGAKGLMQIMPATAKWLNQKLKIKYLDLYNPRHSIELGAVFYAWLNKISDGDFEKMAIAYNAGPGRLKQWINRYYKNDFEAFLEKIPADETYYYVQKTRKNYDRYKILLLNE